MICSIIVFHLFLIFNFTFCYNLFNKLPEIFVYQIEKEDSFKFINVSDIPGKGEGEYYSIVGNDIIVNGNALGITLKCTANYPVYWTHGHNTFESVDASEFDIMSITSREGDVSKPPDKWIYSAILNFWILSPSMTRNYSCRSPQNGQIQSSIYLFAEGYSPTYLIHAGKSYQISLTSKKEVIAPCTIITPQLDGFEVKLYKQMEIGNDSSWESISANESISYDPHKGFSFIVSELPGIHGVYKCTTDDENDSDVVNFEILNSDEVSVNITSTEPRTFLQNSASVYIDYESETVLCCSDNDVKPRMALTFCFSPSECEMIENTAALQKVNNYHSFERVKNATKNCSQESFFFPSFWLKCEGDGIDVFELYSYYFYNRSTSFKGYFSSFLAPKSGYTIFPVSSRSVSLEQIMWISSKQILNNDRSLDLSSYYYYDYNSDTDADGQVLYSMGKVIFRCYKSVYFFSSGNYWEIKWKNGTSKKLDRTNLGNDEFSGFGSESVTSLIVTVDVDMTSITCYVPTWNTSEWASKSMELVIKQSSRPLLLNKHNEFIYWNVNDTGKSLKCEFNGQPTPTINWIKDGKELNTDDIFEINSIGSESTLKFSKKITHDIHGQYLCNGTNFAGSSVKTFSVFVEENSSSNFAITFTIAIGVLLTLAVIFLVIMGWKYNLGRKTLQDHRIANEHTYQPSQSI